MRGIQWAPVTRQVKAWYTGLVLKGRLSRAHVEAGGESQGLSLELEARFGKVAAGEGRASRMGGSRTGERSRNELASLHVGGTE